jgi:hypothetical protein
MHFQQAAQRRGFVQIWAVLILFNFSILLAIFNHLFIVIIWRKSTAEHTGRQ